MEETPQGYQRRLSNAVHRALETIGKRLRSRLRQVVSIPVEIDSGGFIWRSQPGEPPRREHGELYKSIKYKVKKEARAVEDLYVYTTSPKAAMLEAGTVHMDARPWFFPTLAKAGNLKEEFKRLVVKYMKETEPGGSLTDELGRQDVDDSSGPEPD